MKTYTDQHGNIIIVGKRGDYYPPDCRVSQKGWILRQWSVFYRAWIDNPYQAVYDTKKEALLYLGANYPDYKVSA